jgi:hypothetical protein
MYRFNGVNPVFRATSHSIPEPHFSMKAGGKGSDFPKKRAELGFKDVIKELDAAVRGISGEPESRFKKAPCREKMAAGGFRSFIILGFRPCTP